MKGSGMKSNVAKLALWLILCLVAVGLWLLGAVIVTNIVAPLLVNLPAEEHERQVIQFDTDGNGQLSEAEQTAARANTAVVQQVDGLDQQLNALLRRPTKGRS